LGLRDADVETLGLARAVAVARDAFAVEVEREEIGLLHVLDGGRARKVDRLRDRGVAPILERSLHANVPFRRDVVGGGEDPLPLLGDLVQSARGAVVDEDFLYEVLSPVTFALRDMLERAKEIG